MSCQNCDGERVINASGRCEDSFTASIDNNEYEGSVPKDLGIGGGEFIEFEYCLDCGQIQGDFPLGKTKLERSSDDDDEEEEEDDEL